MDLISVALGGTELVLAGELFVSAALYRRSKARLRRKREIDAACETRSLPAVDEARPADLWDQYAAREHALRHIPSRSEAGLAGRATTTIYCHGPRGRRQACGHGYSVPHVWPWQGTAVSG